MANDWYARKALERQQQAQQPAPQYRQQEWQVPPGFVLVPVQQVQQNGWSTQQAPKPTTFSEALAMSAAWKGESELGRCPKCGSNQLFLPSTDGTIFNQNGQHVSPPPHCYACGFNGRFIQADAANWGTVVS